jgi:LAO/AO transport system kinase
MPAGTIPGGLQAMPSIKDIHGGDRRALAKALTILESTRADHRQQAEKLISQAAPLAGSSIRIGLTGVPGVGKSTMIEALGNHVIKLGHKLAVLAVDPSSTISGGSILGDKTRMPTLSVNPNAFIRPTPTGGTLGGVARRTRDSIVLCEAAGFGVIIVETVGVGQSESMVSDMTDLFLLMLLPGGGDELQGIKRGVMELADIVVINKADSELLPRARLAAADVQQALRLINPRHAQWPVPVLTASALHNTGIDDIWTQICAYQESMQEQGLLQADRRQQAADWLLVETREQLLTRFTEDPAVASELANLQQQVRDGELSPSLAANKLVSRFVKQPAGDEDE